MENCYRESLTKSDIWKLIKKLPGKSCRTGEALWLPVWMHAMDTAGIMENLLREWLPSNIHAVLSAEMTEDIFANTCMFAALVHDLGKFTPAFADLIADSIDECRTSLEEIGLSPKTNGHERYIHAFGSAAILYQRQCPEGLAIIAASHHGIPPNSIELNSFNISFCGDFKCIVNVLIIFT